MRKGILALFAGLWMASGMAMAQAPAALSPATDAQPAKETPPFSATPTILNDCNPSCGERRVCGPPGRFWISAEYLYWWTKEANLPPLVTVGSATDPSPGALGQPGTAVLFGGDSLGDGQSGGRFTAGFWFDECHTKGFEADYFFLGTQTNNFTAGGNGLPGSPVITRPFIDIPPTGGAPFQNSEIVAFPGAASGVVNIRNTSQLQGASANGLCNLYCCDNCCPSHPCADSCSQSCCTGRRLDLIGGFRWLQLNEDLTITEDITSLIPMGGLAPGGRIIVTDNFQTHNDFYGGQIGLRGEWWWNRFFVNAKALVALGTTHEQVTISGSTAFVTAAGAVTVQNGGLLALPTNIGSYSRDIFTVVPEVDVNIGYQVSRHLRAFVGYTFIDWSNVVRPGDIIDTRVNPSQLPSSTGPGTLVGSAHPAFAFHGSNYWAQGINVGLEFRY